MKTSVNELILRRFRINYLAGKDGFVNSQKIQDIMHDITGHKHEYIGRQLRILAERNLLDRKEMKIDNAKVASVYYRYKPSDKEIISYNYKHQ